MGKCATPATGFIRFFKRDQDTPKPVSPHEVACAVDGIDNPAPPPKPAFGGAFFTEDAAIRELALDGFAYKALIFLVGDCNRRSIRLGLRENTVCANALALPPAATA